VVVDPGRHRLTSFGVLSAHPERETTRSSFDNPANEPDEGLPGA
jgi:hypothetical protein